MSPKTQHPSISSVSVALPPIPHNVPKVPLAQAIAGILQLGKQLMLNRCQLKRLGAACQNVYQSSFSNPQVQMLLARVHARSRIWRSANPLESLVLLPSEMNDFETELSRFSASQSCVPSPEDERSEIAAIISAFKRILSNETDRSRAMTLRGYPAELFVSRLQTALDQSPYIDREVREEWIKALRKLAVEADVLPSDLKIDEVTFIGARPVARGGFSDVYQGKWKDKVVAVKRPRCDPPDKDNPEFRKQLLREVLLWRQLSPEYVLRLLGVFKNEDLLYEMVSEWMPNGTLEAFLENHQDRNRLQLVCQVASALEYLHTHSPPIAHGDIKAKNVFINGSFRPVLGDFGLSSLRYTVDRTMSSTLAGGTIRWMAPELLRPDSNGGYATTPTLESDIWAFAMLVIETFTGRVPYANEIDIVVIVLISKEQKLPDRPGSHITERGLTDDVWGLLNMCWNFTHPERRPSASYLRTQLEKWSQDTQITAENERIKTMLIPKTLVDRIITSNGDVWKPLGVRIVKQSGNITQSQTGVPMVAIQVTGRAAPVAAACLRLEYLTKISADVRVTTGHIDIPKEFHSRMIGHKHCNRLKLEKIHGVQIKFPSKQSRSTQVNITGSAEGIEKTKDKLLKMLWFERTSRDVLEVSSRVAEKVEEQRKRILRPPLWGLKVESHGDKATITLRGKREGIIIAQKSIRAIEEEVKQEITEDIPLDSFLHDMIISDRQAWVDIVDRCEGPPNSDKYPYVLSISPNRVQVRGPPNLINALRTEVDELINIGHHCVLAKRISARRHQSLRDTPDKLTSILRKHTKATVYFPKSGGYRYIGKPENMDGYSSNVDFNDFVKVVGHTHEDCQKAKDYLEGLVEEQRRRERNPVYLFPAILYDAVRRKLDPMFDTLGITVESKVPRSNSDSIICLVSENQDLITESGPEWSIHMKDTPKESPLCEMQLISQTDEDSIKAGQALEKEAGSLWRRIGVLKLQRASHVRLVKKSLELLVGQTDDLHCEVVEHPTSCRLVIGGPSTNLVESVITAAMALIEAEDD